MATAGGFNYIIRVSFRTETGNYASCISADASSRLFVCGCVFYGTIYKTVLNKTGAGLLIYFAGNVMQGGKIQVKGPDGGANSPKIIMLGNESLAQIDISLDSTGREGIIANNSGIKSLVILNTSSNTIGSRGLLITGNSFASVAENNTCLTLGENTRHIFVTGNNFTNPTHGTQHLVQDNGIGNIIRFNSNDSGGGSGGGTAGVSSFKGRSGAVTPQTGDYTAEMVGAIPTSSVAAIQSLTQEEYDALAAKDEATLYLIKE